MIKEAVRRLTALIGTDALKALQVALMAYENLQELVKNRTLRIEIRRPLRENIFLKHDFPPEGGVSGFLLAAEIRTQASGGRPAGSEVLCGLENFALSIAGDDPIFVVSFARAQFIMRANSKPDIDIVLRDIEFRGPLRFIERIKDVLPLDGFSDPPAIEVGLDGLSATFTMPLPDLAVGVMSLENLSITAGFHTPFIGEAISIHFAFCTRENPFLLTVSFLGGGGFFGMELIPNGIRRLEAALEFGASPPVECKRHRGQTPSGEHLGLPVRSSCVTRRSSDRYYPALPHGAQCTCWSSTSSIWRCLLSWRLDHVRRRARRKRIED